MVVSATVLIPASAQDVVPTPAQYNELAEEWCLVPAKMPQSDERRSEPGINAEQESKRSVREQLVLDGPNQRHQLSEVFGGLSIDDAFGDLTLPTDRQVNSPAQNSDGPIVVRNSKLAAKLETGTENSRAAITWNRTNTIGEGAMKSHTVEFSAPVAKSDDTQLANLGNFASDAKLSYSFVNFWPSWKLSIDDHAETTTREKMLNTLRTEVNKECPADHDSPDCLVKRALLAKLRSEDMLLSSQCIAKFAGEEFLASGHQTFVPKPSTFFGISGSVGYQSFSSRDSLTFEETSTDKMPWSAELFVGRYSADRNRLVRAGYSRVEGYKASEAAIRCRPADTNDQQECYEASFEGPEDDNQDVGFVELRHRTSGTSLIKAATLKLSYDFANSEPEVSIPLYMFSSSDGTLNGGVRLSWNEKENIAAGLFIGTKFSVDP